MKGTVTGYIQPRDNYIFEPQLKSDGRGASRKLARLPLARGSMAQVPTGRYMDMVSLSRNRCYSLSFHSLATCSGPDLYSSNAQE